MISTLSYEQSNPTLQCATAVAVEVLSAANPIERAMAFHTSLLLAEALHALCRSHGFGMDLLLLSLWR